MGKILGDIHLAGQDFLGGVLFLCKKTFHIFLCLNQLLDLIPCFALVDLFEFEVIVTAETRSRIFSRSWRLPAGSSGDSGSRIEAIETAIA